MSLGQKPDNQQLYLDRQSWIVWITRHKPQGAQALTSFTHHTDSSQGRRPRIKMVAYLHQLTPSLLERTAEGILE